MSLTLNTPPAAEPLSLADVYSHLRITPTGAPPAHPDDPSLQLYITAARQFAENDVRRALITQTWDLRRDRFPQCGYALRLPLPPLQSVAWVRYIDTGGVEQTLDPDSYIVDANNEPGRITMRRGLSWPATDCVANAVAVRFTAGYGVAGTDVPHAIRAAMLLTVGGLYENREDAVIGSIRTDNPTVNNLLAPYRVMTMGAL